MLTQTSGAAQDSDPVEDNNVEAASVEDDGKSCCIGCFRLLSSPPELLPEGCNDSTDLPEPDLLCASCIHRLADKSSKSLAVQSGSGVLSPLPKLSFLVKAEAKCQDQLHQLRIQQEILKQQRESLEATKRAKEEALTAERELARQRRKHFLMIQERRKREEEAKFQQFQSEEHTSRSEQDASTDKKKKKKPKPPKVETPPPKSATVTEAGDLRLLHLAEPCTRFAHTPLDNSSNSSTAEGHSTTLSERRKQMMACYSQDLAPLIDGRKPRRLPFPKPIAAIVPSVARRKQTPDNNVQITTLATHHRSKNQPSVRKQDKGPTSKTMRLRPLEERKRYIQARPHQQSTSNQFEDVQVRENNEHITKWVSTSPQLLQPPRRLTDHYTPLTAEIKPVSWAYELTKDVLPQDDSADGIGNSTFSAPLHPVIEEGDYRPQFTMFPLQHQLPYPTFPPSKPEPPVEVTTKVPRWEYSAERLSSLLEKYNVSVSAVSAATSAPNL